MLAEAPLCSDAVSDKLLKHFVCPRVSSCGQKIFKANAQNHIDISINPFETFMSPGDKCSYLLSVDDYEQGDMIELSAIDFVKMELVLFHGGYSLGSATMRTPLENGKRYLVDGTQKLFLMANTLQNSSDYASKPYFSLAMKKVGAAAIGAANEEDLDSKLVTQRLTDESILSTQLAAKPITLTREREEVNVTTVELYTQKV